MKQTRVDLLLLQKTCVEKEKLVTQKESLLAEKTEALEAE